MPKHDTISDFQLVDISDTKYGTPSDYGRKFLAIVAGQGINEGEAPAYFTFSGGDNLYDVFDRIKEHRDTSPEAQVRAPPVPADRPGDPGPFSMTESERLQQTGFTDPETDPDSGLQGSR